MATKTKEKVSVTELLARFTKRPGAVVGVPLQQTAEDAMKRYGFETVLNRALPDYRDGCPPSRRKALWAMYKEKNNSGNKRQKSAKAVGNTIANYHPHGDVSVYGAIVSMVNAPEQLCDGEGNWGGPTSGPAAMRYTNVRISKYADSIFFDKRYLPVIEMVPNFDGTTVEPVLLPALLPNILLNGLDAGIGVGVSGCMPPFKKEGVKKLIRLVMQGKPLTAKICYETLEFNYISGCHLYDGDQRTLDKLVNFFKTGIGSAVFVPDHAINKVDRILTITGVAPLVNVTSIMRDFGENSKGRWDFIQEANDLTDKDSDGLLVEVIFKKPESNTQFDEWCHAVIDKFANQVNYRINVVETFVNEKGEGDAQFRRFTLVQLIEEWCKWRVELEVKALQYEHGELTREMRQTELKLLVATNADAFVQAVRSKDELSAICTLLDCSTEEAEWLLERPLRTLTNASEAKLREQVASIKTTLEQVAGDLADPKTRVIKDLEVL